MLITTGKVLGGTIGAVVTVLAPEGGETFELAPEEEIKLLRSALELLDPALFKMLRHPGLYVRLHVGGEVAKAAQARKAALADG